MSTDGFLEKAVSGCIYRGRSFIKNEDFWTRKDGAGKCEKLLLTNREVLKNNIYI